MSAAKVGNSKYWTYLKLARCPILPHKRNLKLRLLLFRQDSGSLLEDLTVMAVLEAPLDILDRRLLEMTV